MIEVSMPVNETPCEHCVFFKEIYSPQPVESWNRCSHIQRRLHDVEDKYKDIPVIAYGYADHKCAAYKESILTRVINYLTTAARKVW